MLSDVSSGCISGNVAPFANDEAVDVVGDGNCVCWLHRKHDLMDYGVMDNPDLDCRAEVSAQKCPINHQQILFEQH